MKKSILFFLMFLFIKELSAQELFLNEKKFKSIMNHQLPLTLYFYKKSGKSKYEAYEDCNSHLYNVIFNKKKLSPYEKAEFIDECKKLVRKIYKNEVF